MKMKKLFTIVCIFLLLISGCSKGSGNDAFIKASDIVTPEEVAQHVGYEPIATENNTQLFRSVKYQNTLAGQGDITEVLLYTPNERRSAEDINELFEEKKSECAKFDAMTEVADLDAECFISIPSIYIFKNGCYAVITAGSGAGEEQTSLLKELAAAAIEHISELFPNAGA